VFTVVSIGVKHGAGYHIDSRREEAINVGLD
jgi:hypothetical protein